MEETLEAWDELSSYNGRPSAGAGAWRQCKAGARLVAGAGCVGDHVCRYLVLGPGISGASVVDFPNPIKVGGYRQPGDRIILVRGLRGRILLTAGGELLAGWLEGRVLLAAGGVVEHSRGLQEDGRQQAQVAVKHSRGPQGSRWPLDARGGKTFAGAHRRAGATGRRGSQTLAGPTEGQAPLGAGCGKPLAGSTKLDMTGAESLGGTLGAKGCGGRGLG